LGGGESLLRQEIKKEKEKRNCNLWTTLGGEFTMDGEGGNHYSDRK
jgi:hypothetical protein